MQRHVWRATGHIRLLLWFQRASRHVSTELPSSDGTTFKPVVWLPQRSPHPSRRALKQTLRPTLMQGMIIAALRYWVQEMHVDGFRFDLASIMTRAPSVWHPTNRYPITRLS